MLRFIKKTLIVLFHICTLGLFLLPHALLHYVLGGNKNAK